MWILDESSYRIDKTNFANREEAEQKAGEAARILGRPISVYQLIKGELIFDFKVMPDGSVSRDDPTSEPEKDEQLDKPTTPILGSVVMDEIAEVMEQAGRPDLAAVVDAEIHQVSALRPPNQKKLDAAKKEFDKVMEHHGAKKTQGPVGEDVYRLDTPAGLLRCEFSFMSSGAIFCRWEDVDKAKTLLGHDTRLNQYSGKWNFHHDDPLANVAEFGRTLEYTLKNLNAAVSGSYGAASVAKRLMESTASR